VQITNLSIEELRAVGQSLLFHGRLREAEAVFEELQKKAKAVGDDVGLGWAVKGLAEVNRYSGQPDYALHFAREALTLANKTGDSRLRIAAYNELGSLFLIQGDYNSAAENFGECLKEAKAHGYSENIGTLYGNIGMVLGRQGKPNEAHEAFDQAVRYARASGNSYQLAQQLVCLAQSHFDRRGYAEAEVLIAENIDLCDTNKYIQLQGRNYGSLGLIRFRQGKLEDAKGYLEKASSIALEISDEDGLAKRKSNLAQVYAAMGQSLMAHKCFEESIRITERIGDVQGAAVDHMARGNLYAKDAKDMQTDLALLHLTIARDYFAKLGDTRNLQVAEALLKDLEKSQ